jgi:FO synthase
MNETISRAAGASHGQEMAPAQMEAAIASIGRRARPRTTLYRDAPAERIGVARSAPALVDAPTKTLVVEPAR